MRKSQIRFFEVLSVILFSSLMAGCISTGDGGSSSGSCLAFSSPSGNTGIQLTGTSGSMNLIAQAFTPSSSGTVSDASVALMATGGSGTVSGNLLFAIAQDDSGTPGTYMTNLLVPLSGSTSANPPMMPTTISIDSTIHSYAFNFSSSEVLTAGTQYWVVMGLSTSQPGVSLLWEGSAASAGSGQAMTQISTGGSSTAWAKSNSLNLSYGIGCNSP